MTKEKEDDQSMEEILQSIKKIISDEDEEGVEAEPTEEAPAKEEALELTDVLQEDGSVVDVTAADEAEDSEAKPEEEIELVAEDIVPEEEPAKEEAAEKTEEPAMDAVETLLSQDAADAASDALKNLPTKAEAAAPELEASPALRSGTTVEDLVVEALKPMLKEWLDANLPKMVEHLVEKEIKKLTD